MNPEVTAGLALYDYLPNLIWIAGSYFLIDTLKDELKKMPITEAKGIEINVEFSSGMLVYELKVPLVQSQQHPYAIGAEAGSSVGIGLEVSKMKRQDMRREMSGGRGGGGPTGRMRGGAGGRGMPGGRGRPQMGRALKIWAVVQLASNNSAVQE